MRPSVASKLQNSRFVDVAGLLVSSWSYYKSLGFEHIIAEILDCSNSVPTREMFSLVPADHDENKSTRIIFSDDCVYVDKIFQMAM